MNSQRSRDLNELKRQVLQYYSVNADVPKRIEEALNSLFYDSPYDIYGYLSDYFIRFSKPAVITKVVASKSAYYDSKCQVVFRLDVHCLDKNKDNKLVSVFSPCNSPDLIHDSTILQYIQEDDTLRSLKLVEIIKYINSELNDILKQFNPLDQTEIDEKLTASFLEKQRIVYEKSLLTTSFEHQSVSDMDQGKKSKTPSTPKQPQPKATASKAKASTLMANSVVNVQNELEQYFQKNFFGLFALSFISRAVCLTSIALSNKQPFERVSQISSQICDKYRMPIPMISVLQNGKGFAGKQNLVKEYILMPKPNMRVSEGIDMISKINRNIRDTLYASKVAPGVSKSRENSKLITNNSRQTINTMTRENTRATREKTMTKDFSRENTQQRVIRENEVVANPRVSGKEKSLVKEATVMPAFERELSIDMYNTWAMNKTVTDQGCLTQMLETAQQGIDVIETAINTCFGNFDNTTSLNMALNIAAHEIYEMDKIRYEVSVGVFKSPDEMIEQYIELLKKNPKIIMLIDPFHPSDHLSWYKLNARVSSYCLIASTFKNNDLFDQKVNGSLTDRPLNVNQAGADEPVQNEINIVITKPTVAPRVALDMPVTFYKLEGTLTVTELVEQIKEVKGKDKCVGITGSFNETEDSFISDLAVGNQVSFMRLGGFNRAERVSKINRLIEIENYLSEKDQLVSLSDIGGETTFNIDVEVPEEHTDTVQTYKLSMERSGPIGKK